MRKPNPQEWVSTEKHSGTPACGKFKSPTRKTDVWGTQIRLFSERAERTRRRRRPNLLCIVQI
jgi:hypothetical protein